jgi:hypothetical protein
MMMTMCYTKLSCYFGRRPLSSVISNTTFHELNISIVRYSNESKKCTYSKGVKYLIDTRLLISP